MRTSSFRHANAPAFCWSRLRHPQAKPIKSVSVNGQNWLDFDAKQEWVRIERPNMHKYTIIAKY